jgi:hypothetical protein
VIGEFERIALTRAPPEKDLVAGEAGTAVFVHEDIGGASLGLHAGVLQCRLGGAR